MPVTWNTVDIDGVKWLVWQGQLRVPLDWDPNSGVFVAVTPPGGIANLPALVKGDNGFSPLIQTEVVVTEIEWDDPTPVSSTWVLLTPGTETTAPVYQENRTARKGPPGADGTLTIEDADDLSGTASARKIIVRNDANNGFVYQTQKVGNVFWPASIAEASADTAQTLGVVNIAAQDSDCRLVVSGGSLVTGDNIGDCVVNLLARLNGETGGNVIGRSIGRSGILQAPHVLFSAPPAGSADTFNKVLAGNTATVHLRAERQSGADTFGTTSTLFSVQVVPIP